MTSTVAQTPVLTEFDGETTEAEFLFHPELSDCVQSRVRFQGRGAGAERRPEEKGGGGNLARKPRCWVTIKGLQKFLAKEK